MDSDVTLDVQGTIDSIAKLEQANVDLHQYVDALQQMLRKYCLPMFLLKEIPYHVYSAGSYNSDAMVLHESLDPYGDPREPFMPTIALPVQHYSIEHDVLLRARPDNLLDIMKARLYRDVIYPINQAFLQMLTRAASQYMHATLRSSVVSHVADDMELARRAMEHRHPCGALVVSCGNLDMGGRTLPSGPVVCHDHIVALRGYPELDNRIYALSNEGVGYIAQDNLQVQCDVAFNTLSLKASWNMGMVIHPDHSVIDTRCFTA